MSEQHFRSRITLYVLSSTPSKEEVEQYLKPMLLNKECHDRVMIGYEAVDEPISQSDMEALLKLHNLPVNFFEVTDDEEDPYTGR